MPQKVVNSGLSGLIWAWYGLVRAGERPIEPMYRPIGHIEAYCTSCRGESRSSEMNIGASGCSGLSGASCLDLARWARMRVHVPFDLPSLHARACQASDLSVPAAFQPGRQEAGFQRSSSGTLHYAMRVIPPLPPLPCHAQYCVTPSMPTHSQARARQASML